MADGWIKLHRKLTGSPLYKNLNSKQRDVMIQCLLLANHQESEWEWGQEKYVCKPGQFITSLENIREKCGCDVKVQSVRTALLKLEKWGFLTNESTKAGRLISIVKWDIHQNCDITINKDTNKQPTNSQQTANKELTTNKNDKNYKNDKKKELVLSDSQESDHPQRVLSKAEKLKREIEEMQSALGAAWATNMEYYRNKYPGRDIPLAIASMREWIQAYPTKAKKRIDWNLFIQNWLKREKPEFIAPRQKNKFSTPTTAELIESEKNHKAELDKDQQYFRQLDEYKRQMDAGEISQDEYHRLCKILTDEYEGTA